MDVQSHSGTVLGFLSEFRRLQSASPAMQTHGQRITNGGLTRGGVMYHHNRNPTCLVRSVIVYLKKMALSFFEINYLKKDIPPRL